MVCSPAGFVSLIYSRRGKNGMKRYSLLLVVLLFIVLPLTVMGQNDDTVVIRNIGNLTSFNPILYTDGASVIAANYLWPQLFETDSFTGEPIPGLTSWTISDDNLTYTFTIRDDANWSDGKPITSADVKFVVDAIKSDKVASPYKSSVAGIAAFDVIDDKTFAITLTSPSCVVWSNFADIRVVPSYRFAPDFSDIETNPINTKPDISGGSYILDDAQTGEFEKYHANPTYWGGTPQIPFLVNRVIEDPAVLSQALAAGEIDYASMRGDEFEQLPNKDNINFFAFPQHNTGFLALNWADPTNPQPAYDADGKLVEQTPHPIFSDIRVRQAIAMGYNKDDILETLGGSTGGTRIVGSVVPSLTWAFNPELEPYPFDPDAAAKLLDEAGWKDTDGDGIRDKDGKPLSFTISYSDLLAYFETTALVAQDYLSRLGMDVKVQKLEWSAYLNDVFLGQTYDIAVLSNTGNSPPDPDNLAYGLSYSHNDVPGSGLNTTSYVNPEYDALLDQARTMPGCKTADRAPLYYQIQQIQKDQVVYDFTISPNLIQIMNKRIGGFNPGPWWGLYGFTQHVNEFTVGG